MRLLGEEFKQMKASTWWGQDLMRERPEEDEGIDLRKAKTLIRRWRHPPDLASEASRCNCTEWVRANSYWETVLHVRQVTGIQTLSKPTSSNWVWWSNWWRPWSDEAKDLETNADTFVGRDIYRRYYLLLNSFFLLPLNSWCYQIAIIAIK